ncbi:MAG: efflux RND transporter periplasmic adaptor subunit [Planctomycetota bacterium]|jgi:Cu(I)/Ag(I) efflux system membrane fusion protein|nr:efflux RND transporter periplasmic adaptor subunit [Planctomycetota bacterium]MDP6990486.1 efflux RND transporter periplasmic adaptor subunit [Planctomycetota bacterium]
MKIVLIGRSLPTRHALLVLVALAAGYGLRGACAPSPGPAAPGAAAPEAPSTIWSCSMHPQMRSEGPGVCPICGMDLSEVSGNSQPAGERRIVLDRAAVALAEIATTRVERRFPTAVLRMAGSLTYDETSRRTINAWVPGRLERLFVDFEGLTLREGDHVADLYSRELVTAQEVFLQARRTVAETADSELDVLRDASLGTLTEARKRLERWGLTAEQIDELARTGEPAEHVTIHAPTGGVVTHLNKKQGEYVVEGERIATIDDLSHLWLRLDAYESELAWLHYGQAVTFEAAAVPGRAFEGTIAFIAPVLDEHTRTARVRVNVPNADGSLKPGMFARAKVRARLAGDGLLMDPALAGKWICPMHPEVVEDESVGCRQCGMDLVTTESVGFEPVDADHAPAPLVIPVSAALVTGRRAVVYVRLPDTERPTFEGREVILGSRAGDDYIVREGLAEGELVVTHGGFKLDSAMQIQARPSMMTVAAEEEVERVALTDSARAALAAGWEAYAAVHAALAADDESAARDALAAAPATFEGGLAADADLAEAAEAVGSALGAAARGTDLPALRAAFEAVAEAADDLFSLGGAPAGRTLLRVHCPMAFDGRGASWLQAEGEVANPYYGAAMLRCGSVTGEIGAEGSPR